eukprot:sb/3478194/
MDRIIVAAPLSSAAVISIARIRINVTTPVLYSGGLLGVVTTPVLICCKDQEIIRGKPIFAQSGSKQSPESPKKSPKPKSWGKKNRGHESDQRPRISGGRYQN